MKPGENNNILCIGAPGSYKSRGFIIPFLMGCAQRSSGGHHESVVVTDPKGESLPRLGHMLEAAGYKASMSRRSISSIWRTLTVGTALRDWKQILTL